MDEKPNRFINNEEKPLDDNGFSSSSNHQNIDNFDDSSNKLQNDQNNQLNPNRPKNTNPMMNKQNQAKNMQQNDNLKQKARLDKATSGAMGSTSRNPLFRKSSINDGLSSNKVGSTLNKFRHPIRSLFGRKNETEEKPESIDVAKTAKKTFRFVSILSGIITPFLPIIILIIIATVLFLPLIMEVQDIVNFAKNTLERFGNFFSFNGFKTDQELEKEMYERVDKVIEIYPDMSREGLLGVLYYGMIPPEDYLDNLSKNKDEIEEDDLLDFGKMKRYTFTIANQMVYSTVIFDNNIVKVDKTEEKNGQVVVVGHEFKCASGTEIYTSEKELCDENNVAKFTNGPGELDYSSADYCLNFVSDDNIKDFKGDSEFDEKLKCVVINYETNTDSSKQKLENFLRYILLPDTYFDEYSFDGYDPYNWDQMVSKFSSEVKKTSGIVNFNYNIPAYKVGKDYDYYSGLDNKEKRRVDDAINTILALVEMAKENGKIGSNYHIPGGASLPLDFVIRDPIEDTINRRITSPFGERKDPITGEVTTHRGVDFSWVTTEDPIYSMLDGVVYSTSTAVSDCGIGIIIGHDTDGDGKYNYYTRYCHLSAKLVSEGDQVMNGQQIGIMGSTGRSTGRHLHFEIRLEDFNTRVDPVPYLIDIVKNNSQFTNSPTSLAQDDVDNLSTKFYSLIDGSVNTGKGVAISAKFMVDNLNTLPYYCGGYTTELIDPNWFKMNLVTNSTCSNYNTNANYGLDTSGFVSWSLTQAGYYNNGYTTSELLELGDKIDMFDEKVQVGDLAYKGDKIGVIIELDDSNASVGYMDESGIKVTTVNRKLATSLFPNVISMDKFYKKG